MLKALRLKFSALFGTHTLLDKSLRVLQRPTHLPNLTAKDSSLVLDCIHYDVN